MPPNKVLADAHEAVSDIPDGAVIMVAGYAAPGTPQVLVKALVDRGIKGLTCVTGPLFSGDIDFYGAAKLVASGQVKKVITAAPIISARLGTAFDMWREGRLEMELLPQGTLVERIRAGGAGLGGFLIPTATGSTTQMENQKRMINGQEHVLESPIKADFALLCAHRADTIGNLVYRRSQRNWNPIMAMAADVTIVQVDEIVQPSEIDTEMIITPGIYVDRIVEVKYES